MQTPNTILEEKWNAYSHGIGILLSLFGVLYLLYNNAIRSLQWPLMVYGVSLVLMFTASTIYHSVYKSSLKFKLRKLDHISIYYLIAGTYTPICLTLLKDGRGLLLLYLVWGIAIFGTILKLFFTGRFEVFSLVLYGIMGWLVVIDFPFILSLNDVSFVWLAIGGFFYTFGIFFYANRRISFNHLVWHVFVLLGAASHWYFIYSEIVI
ncbi:PAQR family membrane homeostasis protein TrhA [Croceivirga sp. JEA036]|uniref:PAQR family membrane homeostasis protein TrhA n=1 Tax=Croceivirga sp. JEA036 TaxID=2721162 RepID=UPI00143B8FD1|nr:hemolysin III family protein [Croceivirga sp. JEA036]NJB34963.1 hemolysin III family protein [Croceivirga sp. JEA036]